MNLIGQKFNRLTVLEKLEKNYYLCKCECGKTKRIRKDHITRGTIKSCGCLLEEKRVSANIKHGLCKTRIYKIWEKIKERCYNKNTNRYADWGGRGITVCDEWKYEFINFYNWAIKNGYKDNLTIDRIDNNGNYEPNNCRWADKKTQNRNSRNCRYITFKNEKHCLSEWAEMYNINYDVFRARILNLHWNIEKALTTPIKTIGNLK